MLLVRTKYEIEKNIGNVNLDCFDLFYFMGENYRYWDIRLSKKFFQK